MEDNMLVKEDHGQINERIIAKEAKKDFLLRVESARRKIHTKFSSPEVKRLFLRCFDSMQLNAHTISVVARTKLPHDAIEKIEESIKVQIAKLATELDRAIDGAEALFIAHGITTLAEYDAEPLVVDVRVISALGRRYLDLITKVDQIMPMLETLAIDEVITQHELDLRKSLFKRSIKRVANGARIFSYGVRRRMNLHDKQMEDARIPSVTGPTPEPSVSVPAPSPSNFELNQQSPESKTKSPEPRNDSDTTLPNVSENPLLSKRRRKTADEGEVTPAPMSAQA